MSSQEEKDKQESSNLSSTKYILQNLQDFNYLDFCTTFKDNLNDKEDSIRLLKKGLDIIRMSASNKKSTRDLADQLLNDIDTVVGDKRVDRMFQSEQRQLAAEARATQEFMFAQNAGARIFSKDNSHIAAEGTDASFNSNLLSRKRRHEQMAEASNQSQDFPLDPFNEVETEDNIDPTSEDEAEEDPIDLLGSLTINGVDISVSLNKWIKNSKHIKKVEDQDLMRYLIIDNTPTSSSISKNIMDKQALSLLCKHDKAPQFGAEHASAVDFCRSITQGCRSFSQLKQSLKPIVKDALDNQTRTAFDILKIYAKQRVKNMNLLTSGNQTEQGFTIVSVAPIMKTLLEEEENIFFTWGESMLESHANNRDKAKQDDDRRSSGTKIDLKIDIMDEESGHVISNFCLLEVSGPPHIKCHSHFKRDKKRIAKGLKTILNSIYTMNPSTFAAIAKIVLYGVQIYNRQFYVYSLRLIKPKLYLFSLEFHFTYPSSGLELTNMADFVQSLLQMKNAILASLTDVLAYITANNNSSSASTIKQNEIIADTSLTPPRKH